MSPLLLSEMRQEIFEKWGKVSHMQSKRGFQGIEKTRSQADTVKEHQKETEECSNFHEAGLQASSKSDRTTRRTDQRTGQKGRKTFAKNQNYEGDVDIN